MNKKLNVLIQSLFWGSYGFLLLIIVIAATMGFTQGPPIEHIFSIALGLVIVPSIIGFYGGFKWLFQLFALSKRKTFKPIVILALVTFCSGMLSLLICEGKEVFFNDGWSSFAGIGITIILIGGFTGTCGYILKGFIHWMDESKKHLALKAKHSQTEALMVKSKLDPHFLFNSLNNIDFLIHEDVNRASEYLNKLSEILRFSIYDVKEEKIPLEKELDVLEKYIALQSIRTKATNAIDLVVNGDLSNVSVFPMLFLPFVENAIKHGTLKEENSIQINLQISNKKILFSCVNKIKSKNITDNLGVGKALIDQRIALLYGQNHQLEYNNDGKYFKVKLTIHEN